MILSSSVTQFSVYLDVFLSLHIQITKTRNDQLPHQTVFPSGFPHSARSLTILAGHPGLMCGSRKILSFAAPPKPDQSVSRCYCFISLCWFCVSHLLGHTLARWPSNCHPGTRGSPQDSFRVSGGRTIFMINLGCYWLFTFSHKQRVDFSRAHMSCDVTTN